MLTAEKPSPLSTSRTNSTIARKQEIYANDYWKNRTEKHIQKEKNMQDETKHNYEKIRQLEIQNTQLQKELRVKEQMIDDMQLQQVLQETLQRRNCRTSMDTLMQNDNSLAQLNLINEEYFNQSLMKTQIHPSSSTLLPKTYANSILDNQRPSS